MMRMFHCHPSRPPQPLQQQQQLLPIWLILCIFGGCMVQFGSSINGDVNFGYAATTDVGPYLKLALDIEAMRTATTMEAKQAIYTQGTHSTITLQSLSYTSKSLYGETPLYNLYLHAFDRFGADIEGEITGLFDGEPVEHFADTLVQDLFALHIDRIEGTGAVVYNVLQYYWGQLWIMLQQCTVQHNSTAAIAALDTAVALWVGDGQTRNDKQKGYFLYSLSQFAGVHFGQDQAESLLNKLVLEVFVALQSSIQTDACNSGKDKLDYLSIRWQVQLLVQYANAVMVQMLLYHIRDVIDNASASDFVELFSLAILPQIASCDSNLYGILTELTVKNDITDKTYDAAIVALQKGYSCLGITCADVGAYLNGLIPQCKDDTLQPLAGYQPSTDVRQLAQIDRDIRHMDIYMELGSWNVATDLYQNGWNADFTLQQLSTYSLSWTKSTAATAFANYYSEKTLTIDQLLLDVLAGTQPFDKLSGEERQAVVIGLLQSAVMYLGVTGQIEASLTACTSKKSSEAIAHWDAAAALFVGSIEGPTSGGSSDGQSLFAVSKFLCNPFDKCEPTSSVEDTIVLASLQSGATAITDGSCATARQIYEEKIENSMLVAIVQGLLFYTVETIWFPNTDAQGYLLSYTKALLPLMNNPEASALLNISYDSYVVEEPQIDHVKTFEAMRLALPGMKVDCQLVGRIRVVDAATGVCSDDTPPAATAMPQTPIFVPENDEKGLAWGRYTFVDAELAEQDSLFTLDVREMWFAQSPQAAETIYTNPSMYAVGGLSGRPEFSSLRSFSTEAYKFMSDDPMYNFFRYALFEDGAFQETANQTWPYADAVEELAIGPENGNSAQLASQTVVVMEIWMLISNRLYEAVRSCAAGNNSPTLIDSAVGLWIGQEQGEGKQNSGWSIYAVAQEAERLYGMPEKEATVNTALMLLFVEAQGMAKSCSSDKSIFLKLRILIDEIIRNLSTPLLQHLLFHMSDNNFEYVELYALSFIPQVVSVDTGAFDFLRDRFFEGFNWEKSIDLDLMAVFSKSLYALRFTCSDLGDVSDSSGDNLKALVDAICTEMETTYESDKIAAYQTSADVEELSRIDLDLLQIVLFMRVNAYKTALDVYTNGRNARVDNTTLMTLKSMATNAEGTSFLATLYKDFFQSDTYPDDIITATMTNSGFDGASRSQYAEAARRTLQTMVIYLQICARLQEAVKTCTTREQDSGSADLSGFGQDKVDEAVALYVGSIEGPFSGGNLANGGQLMYALAKDMCTFFGTCESHGEAMVNLELLFSFAEMKENLDNKKCLAAQSILEDKILSSLPVPIIQSILYFASVNEGLKPSLNSTSFVAGEIVTEVLLPQMNEVNETSVLNIMTNLEFKMDETSVKQGMKSVVDSLTAVLGGMGVDCAAVGVLLSKGVSYSVCSGGTIPASKMNTTESAPPADTPMILGDNIYQTTTFVQNYANIAKDIVEIEQEISHGRIKQARLVYDEGLYSEVYDDEGKMLDNPRALAKFSKDAAGYMQENPLFQVTVYALRDERGLYAGNNASRYADTIVDQMFEAGSESREPLAAEAAVALNLWMELVNELFETVKNCKNKVLTDADGIHSIDQAAAYWIGDGQITGSTDHGHLLYALGEQMARQFSILSTPHGKANNNILRLFHQAKLEMSLSNACTQNDASPGRVRQIVDKIVSEMLSVNIQALIHFLRKGDRNRVRIYAHAVVPLVAGCSPTTFHYLKTKLLDASYLLVDVEQIITEIRSTLFCFGLKCDDIGVHFTEPSSACVDPSLTTALADYKPANNVREYAKVDLDVLELDILMIMEAYTAASDLYSFGKHVSLGGEGNGAALSLEFLATNSGRSVVPQFHAFKDYFGDDSFANTIVKDALSPTSKLNAVQRRAVVVGAARYMILPMSSLEAMYDSIRSCSSTDPTRKAPAGIYWDMAAALVIGSLEGSSIGGSRDGLLVWALSKDMCNEFGKCSKTTLSSSETNDLVATLFYTGRGAVLGGSCDELSEVATELTQRLQIPLLQASFSSISALTQRDPGKDKELVQAEAYIYSHTLVPLIGITDKKAGEKISGNLPLQGAPLKDGVRAVSSAFADNIKSLGVDCEDVGSNDDIDACSGSTSTKWTKKFGIAIGVILGSSAVVAIFFMIRGRRKMLPENQPLFIASDKGEFNHTSDLMILNRTDGSTPGDSDEGEDCLQKLNDASSPEDDESHASDAYLQAMQQALSNKLHDVV